MRDISSGLAQHGRWGCGLGLETEKVGDLVEFEEGRKEERESSILCSAFLVFTFGNYSFVADDGFGFGFCFGVVAVVAIVIVIVFHWLVTFGSQRERERGSAPLCREMEQKFYL